MRFFAVSAVAFLVDLIIALTAREWLGWSVTLAAAVAYLITAVVFYFAHEYWSFERKGSGADAGRLVRNLAANAAAFVIRIAVIALCEAVYEPGPIGAAVYIGLGAFASLSVNYTLNRFWVFAAPKAPK